MTFGNLLTNGLPKKGSLEICKGDFQEAFYRMHSAAVFLAQEKSNAKAGMFPTPTKIPGETQGHLNLQGFG